jgi:hypothetical protein
MASKNKVLIQIDDEVIELTGVEKDAYLEQQAKDLAEQQLLEQKFQDKQQARADILAKLGLTPEEIAVLGL